MSTDVTSISGVSASAAPGTFASKRRLIPSFGCTRRASTFGAIGCPGVRPQSPSIRYGGAPEVDRDLRRAPRHALARAHVEGHVAPAPVVDVEADRCERRRARVLGHVRLLEVAPDRLALDLARGVLRAHRLGERAVPAERPDSAAYAFTFSSRTEFAFIVVGSSIAVSATSCVR